MRRQFAHIDTGTLPANDVVGEIVRTGRTVLSTGEEVPVTSYIDAACGALLQATIRAMRPKIGVEVGLAFGISTLYILEAFAEVGAEKLIGMDPAQHDECWRGGGLHNIGRAGYEHLYEFHGETSQQVLPALVGRGQRIDFAFIDGWHTFDHVLLDFFYIDQMLNVGGVVVFDDVGYPSIKRVCDFVITNRDYDLYDSVRLKNNKSFSRRSKYALNRLLHPLVRTDRTPGQEARRKESLIEDAYFLALRKISDDSRRWDHFAHF